MTEIAIALGIVTICVWVNTLILGYKTMGKCGEPYKPMGGYQPTRVDITEAKTKSNRRNPNDFVPPRPKSPPKGGSGVQRPFDCDHKFIPSGTHTMECPYCGHEINHSKPFRDRGYTE